MELLQRFGNIILESCAPEILLVLFIRKTKILVNHFFFFFLVNRARINRSIVQMVKEEAEIVL